MYSVQRALSVLNLVAEHPPGHRAANHARAELRVASISQNSSTSQVAGKVVDGEANE